MEFNFMKPDIWDGLVLASILVGAALAVLRLLSDWTDYQRRQNRNTHPDQQQ